MRCPKCQLSMTWDANVYKCLSCGQEIEREISHNGWTKKKLMAFEEDIENEFLAAKIRAPVHLSRGNENQLIKIFQQIKDTDWVFSNHRSHYHALLHGIPAEWLKEQILLGRSMHINSKEHCFMTSSIVNGCVPIAVGVAMALKRKGSTKSVWCVVGDMAASVGSFYENAKYAFRNDLPIKFVIEDNGFSTNTPTEEAWGECSGKARIIRYVYEREYPHINVNSWVQFQ